MMNVNAYLERINYSGQIAPTVPVLAALHRAHLYNVPFENLDLHLGRPVRLEEEALFDKIVTRRRGGFCYELNGLFAGLLRAVGFEVTLLSAASTNDDDSFGPDFDHLALQVTSPDHPEQPWLADVGWGNGFLEPLRLNEPAEQPQGQRVFKIEPLAIGGVVMERGATGLENEGGQGGAWGRHYRFDYTPRRIEEFAGMCHYHQTAPDSYFLRKRIASRFLPDGRVTLSDLRLITTRAGQREERTLENEDHAQAVLMDIFGIDLSLS
jgi:N-hydroxyarylamine O-acetyltransferase